MRNGICGLSGGEAGESKRRPIRLAITNAAATEQEAPMDLQLTNKKALVTGSTAGIGFAIASLLAQEGAAVVVNGRSQGRVEEAQTLLASVDTCVGPRATAVLARSGALIVAATGQIDEAADLAASAVALSERLGEPLETGDAAAVTGENAVVIGGKAEKSEVIVFDLA